MSSIKRDVKKKSSAATGERDCFSTSLFIELVDPVGGAAASIGSKGAA
jgi:hypothetical protein